MINLIKTIILGLTNLLPLVNPLTTVVLFLSLNKDVSIEECKRQAKLVSNYVFFIMIITFYSGTAVMNLLGISISGLRIAGGFIISFIGFSMLFPREKKNISSEKQFFYRNIAFVPLAMPSTAGPGTISMIISWSSKLHSEFSNSPEIIIFAPIFVFFIISFIVWISLRSSRLLINIVGINGIETISRFIGFVLMCMGIQFLINGIFELIENHQR